MYGRQGIELCHLIETFALPTHTGNTAYTWYNCNCQKVMPSS